MAGIAAYFARESVPSYTDIMRPMINAYLTYKMTQNINAVVIKKDSNIIEWDYDYKELDRGDFDSAFKEFYNNNVDVGDLIIIGVGKEIKYDSENKFIISNDSSNCRTFNKNNESAIEYLSKLYIDCKRDMKRTLEECDQCDINLIACDIKKMNLMTANDGHCGLQMCHAYIKGVGFMLHENMVCLRNIIHDFTDCSQDAVNLWETWYGHPLEAEVIRETDLESGAMRKIKFNPKWSY